MQAWIKRRCQYVECTTPAGYKRQGLGDPRTNTSRAEGTMGWNRRRQPQIYQWGVLDSSHGCTMARVTAILWEMGTVYQRFRRWRDKGVWERILEVRMDAPDCEWLMIDASHCKMLPHATGARGGNQDMSRTKGGLAPNFTLRGFFWYAGQSHYHGRQPS